MPFTYNFKNNWLCNELCTVGVFGAMAAIIANRVQAYLKHIPYLSENFILDCAALDNTFRRGSYHL